MGSGLWTEAHHLLTAAQRRRWNGAGERGAVLRLLAACGIERLVAVLAGMLRRFDSCQAHYRDFHKPHPWS